MHNNYLTKSDYEKFSFGDTRYYGVFCRGKKENLKVGIDIKRFQQATGYEFSKEQLSVIHSSQVHGRTHYFHPAKKEHLDYHCNQFESEIRNIKEYWHQHFKPLIQYAKKRVKKPKKLTIGDCDLMMCGVLEPDEADMWARHENMTNEWQYREECAMVVNNMYAQFVHYMASSIEFVTVKVLTSEKAIGEHFDRNILYGTAVNSGKNIKELLYFPWYDKLYSLWNFVKHNSQSTYEKVRECCPEILKKEYIQGESAACVIDFSDDMILELINGVSGFFKEYCELVFHEKFEEAQWNYCRYFLNIVHDEIEAYTNPLGIPNYL